MSATTSSYSVLEQISCTLAVITIPIIFFHSFYYIHQVGKISNSYFLFYFITLILLFIYNIIKLFTSSYKGRFQDERLCDIYIISYYFYSAGKCFMLTFLTNRIYVVFGKAILNPFRRKNCKLIITVIFVCYFLSMCSFVIYLTVDNWYLKYRKSSNTATISSFHDCILMENYSADYIFYFLATVSFGIDIVFSIIVLRLYIRRLLGLKENILRLTKMATNTEHNTEHARGGSGIGNRDTDISESSVAADCMTVEECAYNEESLEFMNVAAKATNLVVISVTSTLVTGMIFTVVGRWTVAIDTIINCLCLYLTFSFGKGLYKVLCVRMGIHDCCLNVCVLRCFSCCLWNCCSCEFGRRRESDVQEQQSRTVDVQQSVV